ncbi:DUF1997 family protein [Citrus sinensis]|nr:DUF1997 family protein [Citrus sinensis]
MQNWKPGDIHVAKGDKFSLNQCPKNDFEEKEMQKIPHASTIRSLMYAPVCTRPDIAYVTGILGRYLTRDVVSWKSAKQPLIASSTMTAEFIVCYKASNHGIWLRNFVTGLPIVDGVDRSLILFCDNKSAVLDSNNNRSSTKSKNTVEAKWVRQIKMSSPNPNVKKANLSATKKERIELPINYDYDGNCGSKAKAYHISEFLSHPSGIQAMLNTSALQSFQFLDTNTYRCVLPKVQFLNFEAAPVMDLRVTPTDKDCTVQLLSCKFEGSDIVESQNDRFSAFMINHMTWNTNDSESFLEVEVKLKLCLEIYTRPFSLLPISAVERPGNLMMQALVDRLVPLLLRQLLQDYDKWVQQKFEEFA